MATARHYPDWLTAGLVQGYKSGVSVEELAETIGYPVASVRWKLCREGVYESKKTKKMQLRATSAQDHGF